jgi:hypothetical protein
VSVSSAGKRLRISSGRRASSRSPSNGIAARPDP